MGSLMVSVLFALSVCSSTIFFSVPTRTSAGCDTWRIFFPYRLHGLLQTRNMNSLLPDSDPGQNQKSNAIAAAIAYDVGLRSLF